ncbi:MAG: hypothetical protein FJ387_16445 [Verrucomicrobia bacterium]|nr:hypothetical protein [Verrucomicrobiota bacterium]
MARSKSAETSDPTHTDAADGANHRLSTGVTGLDEVLDGGLLPRSAYLLRGGPGCGKTTLGLHFLTTGTRSKERVLYISLSEPEGQLRRNANGLGFNLEGVTFLDLGPTSEYFSKSESYDIFSPSEVEQEPLTRQIVQAVERLKPQRVFLDSTTQFRYLSTDTFQYRKQVTSFLRFLVNHGATVLFTSEGTQETPDDDLKFMADGVIELAYAPEGRTLSVIKFRGSSFLPGDHSMRLGADGMAVYPKIFSTKIRRDVEEQHRRIVMIDSIAGYALSMRGRDLTTNLHALGMYLKSVGVTLLLINETENITGEFRATDGNVSYLSDNIVFLRYLELDGQMRKAIGVLKKRAGDFEKTLREIEITRYGLKVGKPLTGLRGILGGTPEIIGAKPA